MERINGICIEGKFYKVVKGSDCKDCDFGNNVQTCRKLCGMCDLLDCAFRYSPELTDKLKGKNEPR